MEITPKYLSSACNQVQHCLTVRNDDFAYGACNALIFGHVDTKTNSLKVIDANSAHSSRVNCVRYIASDTVVSGSTDKTVCLWRQQKVVKVFKGHEGPVTVVDGLSDTSLIVSGSTDSTLRIWQENRSDQVLKISKSGFVLDLAVCHQTVTWVLASLDDCCIHLFVPNDKGIFYPCHRLRGHEDWSQSLSVKIDPSQGDVLLASGGQDAFVRVWRFQCISQEKALSEQRNVKDLSLEEDIEPKADIVSIGNDRYYTVVTETILSGHDDKVFGVEWSSQNELLTASLDKTMIFWEQTETGLWTESVRVGEVGGNTLGFLGCAVSGDGQWLLGYTFTGALHLWARDGSNWQHGVACGGHFGPVNDLDWDEEGRYLVTTGQDQTTRVHAPWSQGGWYEVARPQVHGYDLGCLTMLENHCFASGAEEKMVRVFECPQNFLDNMGAITGSKIISSLDHQRPQGASVPSLGLSNKAVLDTEDVPAEVEKHVKDQFPDFYFKNEIYDRPPPEDVLVQNTLWAEIAKLYGHGYEIFSLASSKNGKMVASSCKASQADHAGIILWECSNQNWTRKTTLTGHTLTVVQMAFSPDGKYLLSVSRDRTLIVWNMEDFSVHFKPDKKEGHQRIIWACDWTYDSNYFVTVGRDKKCFLWSLADRKSLAVLALPLAATAVAFVPHQNLSVVVGLENGQIHHTVYEEGHWSTLELVGANQHHAAIKKLKFQPRMDNENDQNVLLASCGTDHFVQLLQFSFK